VPRFSVRQLCVFLCLCLSLSAASCKGTSSSSSTSSSRGSGSGGTASGAEVRWHDGGPAELAFGGRLASLPSGELVANARPDVMQDDSGKRLAYVRSSGDVRLVYVVGSGTYLGPTAKGPIDFGGAPDLEHALGTLFANAGARRAQLIADVTTDKGDAGVARMLVDGAGVRAREWDEAFAKLPDARASEVKASLASLLERGKPMSGLERTVVLVPLREPLQAPQLAARVRELADPVREPRASAVMLRALTATDKSLGAQVGCEVLGYNPLDTTNAQGTPEEIDRRGRESLVEAALLAIAAGEAECPHVAAYLGDDLCLPSFRCNESGPLTGREPTKQDEPLCTKEQLTAAIANELARPPADALAAARGTRPQLFAFATMVAAGKVPPAMTTAHARRRYALVQPKEPECESGVAPGVPCHCDEAIIRDQTCRHPEGNTVHVGVCKFQVDDKQKKLFDVVASLPP
jgi:hypothetical protein